MAKKRIVATGAAGVCACAVLVTTGALSAHGAEEGTWQKVGDGMTGGVSGMVVTKAAGDRLDLLVARDNKDPGQPRLSAVRLAPGHAPAVRDLKWAGSEVPKDLESLDAVPGRPGEYTTMSSGDSGKFRPTVYDVTVSGGTATVRWSAPLPGTEKYAGDDTQNYEAFAVHQDPATKKYVAVWATRGSNGTASQVRSAAFDPAAAAPDKVFGHVSGPVAFRAPWPAQDEVRHISDLKIAPDGTVVLSSAQDPNKNSGPFSSAVYEAGRLGVDKGRPALKLSKPEEVRRYTTADNRKIEAVALLPDGDHALWGTDDEDFGGSVLQDRLDD
ncbi:hypothetical protein [Streptomyces ochraceiscleroticus]|uniref:Lipoprotein n=1 Tax=Streptomyces ochraceiscleroticus TaxID=47761 RepID=A0ABW1MP29_9ACTN|nr:hypothetical protein [Streptomyces ochraceiscleroticus]